jgi:hypothetical protein
MRRLLPSLGWLLFGLLAIAAAMISAGQPDTVARPLADSYAPSGAAALFALLQSNGYEVEIDHTLQPDPGPGNVAIAFVLLKSDSSDQEESAAKSLRSAAKSGATVFWLPVPTDFSAASKDAASPATFSRPDGHNRAVSNEQTPDDGPEGSISLLATNAGSVGGGAKAGGGYQVKSSDSSVFSSVTKTGNGYEINYLDGIGLTNRFLDQAQNAQAFLEALQAFAPPHAKILFTEATFGNGNDKGLLMTIGAWAEAAWYQLLFLFAVIIYTLNRRFGLPEEYRPKQKGARELLDAITDIYTRAKASGPALEAAADRTDAQLRSVLKLPRDASEGELIRLLPESLMNALIEVRAASEIRRTNPKDALALVKKLEAETHAFLADKRPDIRRSRKAA